MRRLILITLGVIAIGGVLAGSAFADAPKSTSPPSFTGKQMVGQTLTADVGSWTGSPTSYTYQWQRCNRNGDSCGDISNQTAKTYKLQSADVGNTVRLLVTAKNSDGSTTANSKPSDVVSGDSQPRMINKPTISGTAKIGETLTADPGSWAEGPTFSLQWQQCDKDGGNCTNITGATGTTYGVRAGDADHTLRIKVTATNLVGKNSATSSPTALIAPATSPPPPVGVGGAISITAVALPDRLVISQVQFSPRVIRSRTEPVIARFKITDTKASHPVSGALVYAIGVPANRVSVGREVQTDATGWATITFQPLKGLPLKSGARLTFFVRARKPGESVLAGVSTRRLVSLGVSP